MISMMKPVLEHSRTSSAVIESRAVDSATAPGRPAETLETLAAPDPVRRSFGSTMPRSSGSSCKPDAKEFAVFKRRFNGLRIPPSPLHDL